MWRRIIIKAVEVFVHSVKIQILRSITKYMRQSFIIIGWFRNNNNNREGRREGFLVISRRNVCKMQIMSYHISYNGSAELLKSTNRYQWGR